MRFKDFAQKLYSVIGAGSSTSAFCKTLFESIVDDEAQEILDSYTDSSYKGFYNGNTSITGISKKINEQRHAFRNRKAPKILEAFWAWLEKQNPTKGSRLDKAVTYARNQKPHAETYLQDGRCSLSNNPSENSIRPFTVGRKNWLFCDTPGGAHASATAYTMVEMAKAHGLNVEKYLTFLLEKRPHKGMTDEELERLSPWSEEARIYCGYAQQIACI